MQTLIDDIAGGSPDRARRLCRDPLREARHAGYVVSYEQVRIFLGVSLDPGEDLSIVLSLHLTRFNRGKWYQVA